MRNFIKPLLTIPLVVGAFVILSAATQQPDDEMVGTVVKIKGAAFAMQDAIPRKLEPKSTIFIGDVISTGKKSRIEIKMIDDAQFNLGERAVFVVEEYFLKATEGKGVANLLTGAVAVVSGKLASLDTKPFILKTPVATIGVRGTTFWGGQLDGDFQFALLKGKGISVENRAGTVEINKVGDGVLVKSDRALPPGPKTWGQGKLNRAAAMTELK